MNYIILYIIAYVVISSRYQVIIRIKNIYIQSIIIILMINNTNFIFMLVVAIFIYFLQIIKQLELIKIK